MAAKSIINELYQRLRTAAPIYKTQAEDTDGFLCTLTLPAVECEFEALSTDRTFTGRGCSKKEAEHAAAIAGVELLTAEKVLRPDAPTGSHSRGTATASPSVSSATSGVSLPGVGSKRSKSNADPLDEECAESLELRILEALTAVYPKPLNGAQLAKLCGHFKLKSKVNHLLYMKLKAQGLVELLDTPVPAWRAAGRALPAGRQAAAAAQDTEAAHGTSSTLALAAAEAAAAGADACGEDAAHAGAAGQDRTGSTGLACAPGPEGPACSAVLTTSRTSDAVAGGKVAGELSSAAARMRAAPVAAPAALAAGTAGPRRQNGDSLEANTAKQLRQHAAASNKAGGGHAVRGSSSKGQHMSPAASPAPAVARPSASGGGLRGSCSPVPAAVLGRKHQQFQQQQQQPMSSGPHAGLMYGSRGAVPGAGQSDIAKYRQQHMHRPQQRQSAGVLDTVVQTAAAWSPAGASQQQQQQQQRQQAQQQPQLERRQHQQQFEDLAQNDAVLLPQTLAAVAGLGLLDSLDTALLLPGAGTAAAGAAGAAARRSSPMQAYQFVNQPPVSAAQQAHSTSSFGRSLSQSQCSQEPHSQGQPQGFSYANRAPVSHSRGVAASAHAAAVAAEAHVRSLRQCRRGEAASDSDDDISPAVLAAANEAASLEPAPFDAERLSGSTGSFRQQQQQQGRQQQPLQSQLRLQQQQLQPVDLLAAMHINEQPAAQQQQHQVVGPCAFDAVVPQSSVRARAGANGRAPGEAGTKRKYPAYLSTEREAAAAATAAADFMAAEGAAVEAAAAVMQEGGDSDRVMQDSGEQQQEQQEQQGGQQQQQEQQPPVQDADHVHPQRRRRRSGQGDVFSGRGLGLAGASAVVHTDRAPERSRSRGASRGEDEQTGSSDDMQDLQAGPAGFVTGADQGGDCSVGGTQPALHGSLAPGVDAQQPPEMGSAQVWPNLWRHGPAADVGGPTPGARASPAAAAATAWQNGGGLGSLWQEQAAGSSGNPWQWQVQQGRQFTGTAVAADSEGNGSCLSWPAAAAAGRAGSYHQQQPAAGQLHGAPGVPLQQQQQQQLQQYACSGAFEAVRPASPAPCMSGLSVGASAVSGGCHRGSVEPLHTGAAAAGQEVTQPAPATLWQQQQPADLLQSEEQALQLLSRLALPPAGYVQGAGGVEGRSATVPPVGGIAAAPRGLAVHSAVGVSGAVAGDCLTVAMAAAAAAAQAAAAVASAAGLVAAEPPPASAEQQQPRQQQGLHGGSTAPTQSAQISIACTAAEAPTGAGGVDMVGIAGRDLTTGAAAAAGVVQVGSDVVGQTGQVGQTGLGAAGGSSIASAELQAEYERRVGAVRDLVQQLNEALQGLSSLQGQVARPPVRDSLQQQQQEQP